MKQKILIVDDDPDITECLSVRFSLEGFTAVTANSEEEFRKRVTDEKPDAIILDIMLGDKNGVHVYYKLVQEGLDEKIPVMFLSGLVGENDGTPVLPGRKFALYAKPFEPQKLIDDLALLMSR